MNARLGHDHQALPHRIHGCKTAVITASSTVRVASAGTVVLTAKTTALLLRAAVVKVDDLHHDRSTYAGSFGDERIDVSFGEPAERLAHFREGRRAGLILPSRAKVSGGRAPTQG